MSKTRTPASLPAALAVALFLAFNSLVSSLLPPLRIDLTEDGLYTISDGTKQVLRDLAAPVEITYFFSESVARDYPPYFAHGRRVRDLLKDYAARSDGRLKLEIVDPAPFSEEEDRAVAAGMHAVPTASGTSIYMGILARDLTDREARLPFLALERADLLEYDLTRLVLEVSGAERPKIALLSALPLAGSPYGGPMQAARRPWEIYSQLTQLFELETLEPDFTALPDDIDLLLVIHPPALSLRQLWLIDQFVLAGGRAAVFLDPHSEAMAGRFGAGGLPDDIAPASDLGPLLAAWGLEMPKDRIVADFELAQRVNMGGSGVAAVKDYLLWLAARGDAIAAMDPVTASLEQINLASTGALLPIADTGLRIEPLLVSSAASALVEASQASGIPDPDSLLRETVPDEQRYDLVVRVTGEAKSAFPDGPPPSNTEEEADAASPSGDGAPQTALSRGEIAVIVGADSDLFDDRFWIQTREFYGERIAIPIADNGTMLINAIDQMAGSDALIGLRGRGVKARPFEVVERLRRDAEARYRAEEERLQNELAATERRLSELQSAAPGTDALFTSEQEAEIRQFQERAVAIRRDLRAVQRNLVEDIRALGNRLAFLSIALVPILLALGAGLLALRNRRIARRRAQ